MTVTLQESFSSVAMLDSGQLIDLGTPEPPQIPAGASEDKHEYDGVEWIASLNVLGTPQDGSRKTVRVNSSCCITRRPDRMVVLGPDKSDICWEYLKQETPDKKRAVLSRAL
ncbi:uncharacterized protein G6M90_00g063610 [Metarhizium brunneum]|uniref:Uncharacterized protein n=1 Tax=Metarhizium brunneum TaxID=500148 RepID=A0A7D5UWP8_9HYPO|nr:hypothetical protein G6M90_00g063610 [Metarhizium brunneum]